MCGIGTWLETLIPRLEKLGWDVTVGLAWGNRFHDPARIERLRPGMKFVRIDGRSGTEQGRVNGIRKAISATNASIVVLNCLNSGFEAIRQFRVSGLQVRLVAVNHGNIPVQAACLLRQKSLVDLCVCIGRKSLNVMIQPPHGYEVDRICHIANSVSIPHKTGLKRGSKFRMGFAARLDEGSLSRGKRINDLVCFAETFDFEFHNCELWIAGGGTAAAMVHRIAEARRGSVKYVGEKTTSELNQEFYTQLDVLLNFSTDEAFGLSIAEAMAHGVVPITSRFVGLESEGLVLEGRNALVFPVGDVISAIEHVIALQQNPDLLSVLSQNARQHIAESFSPEQSAFIWDRELKRVCTLPELPVVSKAPDGLQLGRFGLPERFWETLRRWTRRRVPHQSAGEEWPHYRCDDPVLIEHVTSHFEQMSVPAHVLPVGGATGVP